MGENGEGQITHKFVTRSNKVNHRYVGGSLGCPGKHLGAKVDSADVNTAPQQLMKTMQRDRSTESRLPIVKPV